MRFDNFIEIRILSVVVFLIGVVILFYGITSGLRQRCLRIGFDTPEVFRYTEIPPVYES
jgi:hypothetical protein